MKVNMSLFDETLKPVKTSVKVNMSLFEDETLKPIKAEVKKVKVETVSEEKDDDEIDHSGKHSKLKTFLLIVAMFVGLGLFVWNMIGLVNHMRLDNQGQAQNIVYEMQDLKSFMDSSEGSGATPVEDIVENDISTDSPRDGPDTENIIYASENEEIEALKQQAKDALNDAELAKQELKNAEDMLDSSLKREAELKVQLEELQKQVDNLSNGK